MAIKITDPKIRVTMINDKVRMYLLPPLFNAAVRAGASIMRVYKNLDDYDISLKDDKTPITLADRVAHKTIREYLGPTRIPILSEEGRKMRYEERRNWELYWLVDPLDGTVEFIKGNNEFTVNIALMENNVCMGAVIYVPYFEKMYIAGRDSGSYLKEHIAPDAAAEYTYDEIVRNWTPLPLAGEGPHDHPRVALSRSHQTPETREHVARLRERHPDLEIVEQGSSYKFCLLAEGRVDYYVRTTHTYEWDTAAGELILAEAGGSTRTLPDGICNSGWPESDRRMPVCFSGLSYEFLLMCSMSQAPQLPEQPATPCPSEQSAPPSASRVSCTAHLMPSFCMFLLVDISESMLCPLIISVRDMPSTNSPTASMAQSRRINHVGIGFRFFTTRNLGFRGQMYTFVR